MRGIVSSRLGLAVISALAGMACVKSASAAVEYSVTDIGELLGPDRPDNYPAAISINGQVAVNTNGMTLNDETGDGRALLLSNGSLTPLPLPSAPYNFEAYAAGINSLGQVAGTAGTVDYVGPPGTFAPNTHAFVYSNGSITDLGTLGGPYSTASAINDSGQVVGQSSTAGNSADHAFLWSGGTMTDLGTLGGSTSYAFGINNSGQIVGFADTSDGVGHAFLYANGVMTNLLPSADLDSVALAINNEGLVVGRIQTLNTLNEQAFLYSDGVVTDIGTLAGSFTIPNAVNDLGQVVGYAYVAGNENGFIYSNGVMQNLNDLIDPALGWTINDATGINDAGQIVAYAQNINDPNLLDTVILTPLPEPEDLPIILLVIGAAFVRPLRAQQNSPKRALRR
jgi:probable HAF family extracellular repeat protein